MTCPLCGCFDVLGWVRAKGVTLRPGPAYMLRGLFENPGKYLEVGDWCDDFGISESTLRQWMRKKRLPAPARWLVMSKALNAATLIHQNPHRSILRLAHDLGYADHTAVIKLLGSQFGITATGARNRLSPEVLLERWWEKQQAKRVAHA